MTALAVGIIPCPGVVMVMLFAIIEPAIETMAGLIIAGLGLFFLLTLR
jgi:ABC-type nickel/cobalt efflux system permease component RcnA